MPNQVIIRIDASMLNAYETCPKSFQYRYRQNIVPREYKVSLGKGDFMHRLLANHYKLKQANKIDYNEIIANTLILARQLAITCDLSAEDCEELTHIYELYADYYQGEHCIILGVEKFFSEVLLDTPTIKIIIEGRIDLITQEDDKSISPIDHKTFARNYTTVSLNNQFMTYCSVLGVNSLTKNKIGLQKTMLSKTVRTTVSGTPALTTLTPNTKMPPEKRFTREVFSYSTELLNEWKADKISSILEIVRNEQQDRYRRLHTQCDRYGGCQYVMVCSSPDRKRNEIINTHYMEIPEWDASKGDDNADENSTV